MREGAIKRVGHLLGLGTPSRTRDWIRPVPSMPDYAVTRDGQVYRLTKGWGVSAGKQLKQHEHGSKGHLRVRVAGGHAFVHRMVCEAFNGKPPPGKPLCLHRDDDVLNNDPGNLYWGDDQDNADDRVRNGIRTGKRVHSDDVVRRIRELLPTMSQRKIAEKLGVKRGIVLYVARGGRADV